MHVCRNVCTYVYVYVRVYVCMYVCMYVCRLSLRSMAFQNRSAAEMWLAQATELMQVQAATLFVLLCGGLVGPKKCKVFSAEVRWKPLQLWGLGWARRSHCWSARLLDASGVVLIINRQWESIL